MSKSKNPILIIQPSTISQSLEDFNESLLKRQAERKLKKENEEFDHFVNTGEVLPVVEDIGVVFLEDDYFSIQSISRLNRPGQKKTKITKIGKRS